MDVAKTENLGEHVSLVPSPPPPGSYAYTCIGF